MKRIGISDIKTLRTEIKGHLQKRWIKIDGIEYLVKYNGEYPFEYQDKIEYIVSNMFINTDFITSVVYLIEDHNEKGHMTENYLFNHEREYRILISYKKEMNYEDTLEEYIKYTFDELGGVPNISEENHEKLKKDFIKTLYMDTLVGNCDRSFNNMPLIYNELTKEYRHAPIHDNGWSFKESVKISDKYFDRFEVMDYLIEKYPNETTKISKDFLNNYDKFIENIYYSTNDDDHILRKNILVHLDETINKLNTYDFESKQKIKRV